MQALAGFIALLAIIAFIFGAVNAAYPIRALKITKRLVGVFIMAGSLATCTAMMIVVPATPPAPATKAGQGPAPAAPSPAAAPAGMTQAEFTGLWDQAKVVIDRCDSAVGQAGDGLKTGDVYAAYPVVQSAQQRCEAAHADLGALRPPRSAKGDAKKAVEKAINDCAMSTFLKYRAMGKVLKVIDGDNRPSAVNDAMTEMQDARNSTMMCILSFAAAGEASHLTLPEFAEAEAAAKK